MAPGMLSTAVCMTVAPLAFVGQSIRLGATVPVFVDFDDVNATNMADFGQDDATQRAGATTEGDPNAGMTWCNVCGNKVGNITNPDTEFQMDGGVTYTCGYLQETVNDVNPNGAPGEGRWCALHQIKAKEFCTCDGPPRIEQPVKTPGVKDCNLCQNQSLKFIPEVNLDLTFDTNWAGQMNCGGLYDALMSGIAATKEICDTLKTSPAAKGCCNIDGVPVPAPAPSTPSSPRPAPSPTKPLTKPPTKSPTKPPTKSPTKSPTKPPTKSPTKSPTIATTPTPRPRPSASPRPPREPSEGAKLQACNRCKRECTRKGKSEEQCKPGCEAECR